MGGEFPNGATTGPTRPGPIEDSREDSRANPERLPLNFDGVPCSASANLRRLPRAEPWFGPRSKCPAHEGEPNKCTPHEVTEGEEHRRMIRAMALGGTMVSDLLRRTAPRHPRGKRPHMGRARFSTPSGSSMSTRGRRHEWDPGFATAVPFFLWQRGWQPALAKRLGRPHLATSSYGCSGSGLSALGLRRSSSRADRPLPRYAPTSTQ
jgi:hypothetical protein